MTRKALTTLFLALGLAVAPAAFAMPMDNGRSETTTTAHAPYGMSQAEYKALLIRGSALNQMYGNAVTHLSATQFKAIYNAGGSRLSPQELAAMVARGQALNAQYGGSLAYPYGTRASSRPGAATTVRPDANGPDGLVKSTQTPTVTVQTVRPDANGPEGDIASTTASTATSGGNGLEWSSAAIGAGSFAFIALLAIASFALTRRRHHPSF